MEGIKKSFVSLFSGCGGFDLGFQKAGFRCAAAFDIDPLAVSVHQKNFASVASVRDLSDGSLPASQFRGTDVVIAGTPCQGFSTAGKRDPKDPRNALLVKAAEIAVCIRPRAVVLENVAGVLAGDHKKYWDRALGMLRSAGYRVQEIRCNAEDFGVPQRRCRIVALAWRSKQDFSVTLPRRPGGTLWTALKGVEERSDHVTSTLSARSKAGIIARHIRPNQKLCNVRAGDRSVHTWEIPAAFGPVTDNECDLLNAILQCRRRNRVRDFGDADPVSASTLARHLKRSVVATLQQLILKGYVRRQGSNYDLVHTFNGKFRRLTWDDPSPTVDTRFGDPYYFLHPTEHRAFSVRETARLQGFPDSFVFAGPLRQQYRLIGNAVPPPLAHAIASFARKSILSA